MKRIEASGHIDKGKLVIYNEEVFRQEIQEVGFVTHFHMILEYGNKRTNDQNAYLYGAVVKSIRLRLLQEGYDFDKDETVDFLERRFCKTEELNHKTGEVYTKYMALKNLTTDQFDKIVIGDIRDWAYDDLGTYIKLPHEYYQMTPNAYDKWKRGEITKKEAQEMSKDDPMLNKIEEMFV